MKVLFLGDIIGRAGRTAIQSNLKNIQKSNQIDFTIVNGENSAGGFGITENICKDLYSYGCDVITTGNHLWDQKEISDYIERDNKLLKPYNFPQGTPGLGFNIYKTQHSGVIPVHDGTSHSIFQHQHTLTRMPFLHFPIICKAETNT